MQDIIRCAVAEAHRWPSLRAALAGRAKRVVSLGVSGAERPTSAKTGRRRPVIPLESRHHFDSFGGSILCTHCLCRAHSWPAARRREGEEFCAGVCIPMRAAFESSDLGHRLCMGVYDGRPTIICISCGAYATERVNALTFPCGQRPPVRVPSRWQESQGGWRSLFSHLAGGRLQEFSPGSV